MAKSQTLFTEIFSSDISPQARETKEKNKQTGQHQTRKLMHSEGNHQQNQKTTHRKGEHIH